MIDERLMREVADEILRGAPPEPAMPRPRPTGRERAILFAKAAHEQARFKSVLESTPVAVAQMAAPREEKSARDLERIRKAEAKRYRRRNRGW